MGGLSAHARRGISLMEVLIATFVAAIGLLGLMSLIPVGKYQIAEGTKSDRGAAIGRAAVHEVQVRDMLNPQMWLPVTADPTASYLGPWKDWDSANYSNLAIPTDWGNSICIDPLFIARQDIDNDGIVDNPTNAPQYLERLGQFPYPLQGEETQLKNGGLDLVKNQSSMPNPPRMTRVSLRSQPILRSLLANSQTFRMDAPLSERIFSLQDDLLFEKIDDNTRTSQLFAINLGTDLADPTDDVLLHRQFAGDYTWLATLTPVERGDVGPLLRNLYTVSVVVFYKRPMITPQVALGDRTDGPPSERLVLADLLGGSLGYGGGDVRLWLPSDWAGTSEANPTDMPNTRAGQWLMLAHWVPDNTLTYYPNSKDATQGMRAEFRWYRVVAAEGAPVVNTATGQPEQYVSLVGSDLRPTPGLGTTVHAALFDGVVAVYQKTMRLER